jgi:hypothetical protein
MSLGANLLLCVCVGMKPTLQAYASDLEVIIAQGRCKSLRTPPALDIFWIRPDFPDQFARHVKDTGDHQLTHIYFSDGSLLLSLLLLGL